MVTVSNATRGSKKIKTEKIPIRFCSEDVVGDLGPNAYSQAAGRTQMPRIEGWIGKKEVGDSECRQLFQEEC